MKVRQEKLYQSVAKTIATAIARGDYLPGTRLPGERELAEEFKVSRPTIRESMIALEIRGLIEARHGSGLYVIAPPPQAKDFAELDIGAFELLEARIMFEGEAAAVAASMIDDATLAELDRILDRMADCAPESAEAMAEDRQFHLLIAEATGNSVVSTMVETLWSLRERAPLSAHMFAEARREGIHPRTDEHRAILNALTARDSQWARAAMRNHLKRVVEDMFAATEVEAMRRAKSEIEQQRGALKRRLLA